MYQCILSLPALQTRLPSELATALKAIMADYEADLSLLRTGGSESEEATEEAVTPLAGPLVFPSGPLLDAIRTAIQVRDSSRAGLCYELASSVHCWSAHSPEGVVGRQEVSRRLAMA